jgi:hypothetical protein
LVWPFAFDREIKRTHVHDEVGERLFVLVSGTAVGPPFVNARRGVSELSFGVNPLDPQSDAQARSCEVESGAHVSDSSIMAISRDCAMKSCRIVLVHEDAAAAEQVGESSEQGKPTHHLNHVDHPIIVVADIRAQ